MNIRPLIALLRPKQWIKNGFIFAPLIFSGQFFHSNSIYLSLICFVIFCIASSSVYIFNDLCDVGIDRLHPVKSKKRPLASGAVKKREAVSFLFFLYIATILLLQLTPQITYVILGYIVLNLGYSLVLKHQPVIDIFTVAIGFVLRVYAGSIVLGLPSSYWMLITTLSLALYLASLKRRQELSVPDAKKVLKSYSIGLLDRYAEMSATGAIIFYSMFVLSAKPELALTVPLVLCGLFRYWYIVEQQDGGESPTDILYSDMWLLGIIVCWLILCATIVSL